MQIIRKFLDWRLSRKLLFIYVVLLALSFFIVAVTLNYWLAVYDEKLYEKSVQELDFFSQQIGEEIDKIDTLSRTIAVDGRIQQQLSQMKLLVPGTAEYFHTMYNLRPMLLEKLYLTDFVDNIVFTDPFGHSITVGSATQGETKARIDQLQTDFEAAKGAFILSSPNASSPYLLSGRSLYKSTDMSLDYLGSIRLTTDISKIMNRKIEALTNKPTELLLMNDAEIIYQSSAMNGDILSGDMDTEYGYKIVSIERMKYFVCWQTSAKTGWKFINAFVYSELYGVTMLARYSMLFGVLVMLIASTILMRRIAFMITKPLQKLSESMEVVEQGDFAQAINLLPKEPNKDEVGMLTRQFSTMVDRIDLLIYENYEKQLLLKDTRYKMLQSQINPHFLNNTLNTINWLVRGKRNEEASKIIMQLGGILSSAMSLDAYTTVAAEVELVRNYIGIQQVRYKNRVAFSIETNGELDQYYLPHFTLQPLVENAICHGVEKAIHACVVSVLVQEEPDSIYLRVADTGPGMTPQQLELVRSFEAKSHGHGIGLKNISERISLAYETSEFLISSEPGNGVTIEIRVPKESRKEKMRA